MAQYSTKTKMCGARAKSVLERNILLTYIILIQREYIKDKGYQSIIDLEKFSNKIDVGFKKLVRDGMKFDKDGFKNKFGDHIVTTKRPK